MSKKANIVIYIFAAFVLVSFIYVIIKNHEPKKTYDKTPRIVKSFNDFYTVSGCINKYINYFNMKDSKAITSLLTKEYKEQNNITEENVFNIISKNPNSIFIAKKILYENVNENLYKYYIYGLEGPDEISIDNSYNEINKVDTYYIIYMNEETKIFAIEPSDGKEFIEGVN